MTVTYPAHDAACEAARAAFLALRQSAKGIVLAPKATGSHVYRPRREDAPRLDLRSFDRVIDVDPVARTARVGGSTTFWSVAHAALQHGLMPAVTPELRTITVGGAFAGIGVESTSFRHGLVHDTVLRARVLTGRGDLVECGPDGPAPDLFRGLPSAYGTLGYVLDATVRLVPVRRYVAVTNVRYRDLGAYFEAMGAACERPDVDFVDGAVFAEDDAVLVIGRHADEGRAPSDYRRGGIYWKSLRQRAEDLLHVADYLWRWDADAFWSTRGTPLNVPWVRRVLGEHVLRSDRLLRLRKLRDRVRGASHRARGIHSEELIQDPGIPLARCAEFVAWCLRTLGMAPMWVCPARTVRPRGTWPLFPMPEGLVCDIGFYGLRKHHTPGLPPDHFGRLVERKVVEVGGIKPLYSRSYYERDEFDRLYGGEVYARLKATWDPDGAFPTVYDKCVKGA